MIGQDVDLDVPGFGSFSIQVLVCWLVLKCSRAERRERYELMPSVHNDEDPEIMDKVLIMHKLQGPR